MKITKITIKGFKNIEKITLNFNKITSLLSINNYGKSNVLQAIENGINFISGNKYLHARENIPLNKYSNEKNFYFEIEYTTTIYKKSLTTINYSYSYDWANSQIITEELKVRKNKETQKFTSFIKRDKQKATYKPSETATCQKSIKIKKEQLVINKLQAYDDLYYIDLIKELNEINFYLDKHFDVEENYNLQLLKPKKSFLPHKTNIPEILNKIKEENKNDYLRIINTFKELFPSIVSLEVNEFDITKSFPNFKIDFDQTDLYEMAGKIYYIVIEDKNTRGFLMFDMMSDGAKRVLTTLIYLTIADKKNVPLIAIEEPENSIHPRLLQQYLIILDSFVENSRIIITSHSPQLINYINPESLYLGIPNDHGLAIFSKIKKSAIKRLIKDAESQNLYLGDYLFDLMSGYDDDIKQIASYTEEVL